MRIEAILGKHWHRQPRLWLAASVAACGLINLLEGLFPKDPDVLVWMADYLPFEVSEHSRMLLLGGGLLQLALSRGLFRGKRTAWAMSLALMLALPFLHLSRAWDWHHSIAQLGLAAALIIWRKSFPAKSDGPSVRWALVIGGVSFAVLTVFGMISIESVGKAVSGERSFSRDLQTVWELIFLQSTDTLVPTTESAAVVFSIISRAALMLAFLTVFLLLRPILPRHRFPGTEAARGAIDEFGVDPLDEFALLLDKRHFVSDNCVVSYALWRDIAVTLADPIGPAVAIPAAIRAFKEFCTSQDWIPVFYEVRETHLPAYRAAGFRTFKIAEDARLDLASFSLSGKKFQNLRTAQNKIQKSGMTFSWHKGNDLESKLRTRLAVISHEWLTERHATEMTFDLGSFSGESLQNADLCVLQDAEGHPIAFATWLPYAQGAGRSLDLMRHLTFHRGVMDAVIVEGLLHYQAAGCREASLGNAPLANIASGEFDRIEERAIRMLFEKFDNYYGYKSLFAFKEKFHPQWTSRYVAYPNLATIFPAMLAIVRVHLPKGLMKFLRS